MAILIFLLSLSVASWIAWIIRRRHCRGHVVSRTFDMKIDSRPLVDADRVDLPPTTNAKITGTMTEEHENGEIRTFVIDHRIVVVPRDPVIAKNLPCGNVIRTGFFVGTTTMSVRSRTRRYAPLPLHTSEILMFVLNVIPGPPYRVTIRMAGLPIPA